MRETPQAAAAFEQYYDLEDRTLENLAQQLYQKQSKPIPTLATHLSRLKKWSAAHGWQERVIARGQEEAARLRKKKDKKIEAMNERHAMIGTTQQKRAIEQIQRLIDAQKFGSQASVQLLKLATDLERLALGAATERSEITGQDGTPLIPVHIWIPDNGRDGYAQQGEEDG